MLLMATMIAATPVVEPEVVEDSLVVLGDTAVIKEAGMITILAYANSLASEGISKRNPVLVGLAAVSYFAIARYLDAYAEYTGEEKYKEDAQDYRNYAMSLLNTATYLSYEMAHSEDAAQSVTAPTPLLWLSDIWRSEYLGPGDANQAGALAALADTVSSTGNVMLMGEGGERPEPGDYFHLLPPEYR